VSYYCESQQRSDSDSSDGDAGTHSVVLNLVRELLERPDIAIDDDFFSAGGDSILGMYLIGELASRTGLRLRVSLLFANPVLRDFCSQVEVLARTATAQPDHPETPLATALRSARLNQGDSDAG
jgi:aryl carrier-like protein